MARRRTLLKGSSRPKTSGSTPPEAEEAATDTAGESEPAAEGDEGDEAEPAAEAGAEGSAAPEGSDAPEEPAAEEPPPGDEPPAAETQPTEAAAPSDDDASLPLSHQATKPPAPRQELPPGLADMQTPIRPDRNPPQSPPQSPPKDLPKEFEETPMGGDWYVGTGQPVPDREDAPSSPSPVVAQQAGVPVPVIVAGVVAGLMVVCAGLWAVLF